MKCKNPNRRTILGVLACLCMLAGGPASGLRVQAADNPANSFTFPHFVSGLDSISQIAVFNPSPLEASVTFTLTNWDGTSLGNPAVVKVPAKGQVTKTASQLFVISGGVLDASLVVSSSTAGIIAFCQILDSAGTFLDGTGSVAADFSLIFPVVPGPQEGDSEIDILNPNVRPAAAELKLRSFSGSVLGTTTVQIPAGAVYRALARDVFPPGTSFEGASHVVATSKPLNVFSQAQTIAGVNLFAGFSSYADPGVPVDLAALNGLTPAQLTTIGAIPFYRTGEHSASFLALANFEPAEVNVDLAAIDNDGSVQGTRRITLPANGGFRSVLQSVFPELLQGEKEGWILSNASGRVYGAVIHGRGGAASLAAIPLQKLPGFEFVVPQVAQGSGFYTELTLANPGASDASTEIYVVKANGDTVGSTTVSLAPGARISEPLDTIFPELVSQTGGYIFVRSSQALFCSAQIGTDSGSLLTGVDCQPLTVWFTPAAQKSFFITGKVALDDQPAAGYVLTLTGPVSGTTISSEDGSYIFRDLKAGKYSLSIAYPDTIEFVPATVSFEITTTNRRQDFQGFTKPSIWGIVTVNDAPAEGFKVTLAGAVSLSTTSGADGTYLFKYLSPGNYTVAIEYQTGFHFSPSYSNFDLGRTSWRRDFPGYTEPNAIVLQPPASPVAGADLKIAVFGKDFNSTSQAYVGAVKLKTTYVSSAQLNVVVPASMLAQPARFDVIVTTNPGAPDQRSTLPYTFIVYQASPTLTSVTSPGPIIEGSAAVTLALAGTGFLSDTRVKINGSSDGIRSSTLSPTQITAEVPASYFTQGGVYPVVVENSYPVTVESNAQLLTVYYSAPAAQSVSPNATPARLEDSAEPLDITVQGYNFRRGAVVLFNDTRLSTTYCEEDAYCLATRLYATVPPSLLRESGYFQIVVRNPDPTLAASEAVFLRVDGLQPTITSVVPGSATAVDVPGDFILPVVVYGTNFGPQTAIRIYRSDVIDLPEFSTGLTLLSSTELFSTITVDYTSVGQWFVEVMNPQPGGGKSQRVAFFINPGVFTQNPYIATLSPTSVPAGGPGFTLTISGVNFKSGAKVQFKSALLTANVVSSQLIYVDVPASLLLVAGKAPVSVINPDNGGTSNRLYLDIR